ncbi:MAG: hypothetical protein ACQERD_01010 [Campylobacterota bacterium]
MNFNIESLTNVILVAHTIILYPVSKFIFQTEKRLTILETTLKEK